MIVWTLNFTVKGFIFGKSSTPSLITNSISNIWANIGTNDVVVLSNPNAGGIGTYQEGEIVYQGYSLNTAVATGRVVYLKNNELRITNINGSFVLSQPIIGSKTNANYIFTTYANTSPTVTKDAKIVVTPNPSNANANTNIIYTTTITEFPNAT
jgi:hypothetical protein